MSAAASSTRARVLSGYRRLFRARQSLFRGDAMALAASRTAIRDEFVKQQAAPPDQLEGLLIMIDEAEDMLRHQIVQGAYNASTGRYRTFVGSVAPCWVVLIVLWMIHSCRLFTHTNHHPQK